MQRDANAPTTPQQRTPVHLRNAHAPLLLQTRILLVPSPRQIVQPWTRPTRAGVSHMKAAQKARCKPDKLPRIACGPRRPIRMPLPGWNTWCPTCRCRLRLSPRWLGDHCYSGVRETAERGGARVTTYYDRCRAARTMAGASWGGQGACGFRVHTETKWFESKRGVGEFFFGYWYYCYYIPTHLPTYLLLLLLLLLATSASNCQLASSGAHKRYADHNS